MRSRRKLLAPVATALAFVAALVAMLALAHVPLEFGPGVVVLPALALLIDVAFRRRRERTDVSEVLRRDPNGEVLRAIYLSLPTPEEAATDTRVRVVRVAEPATGETVKMGEAS